MTDAKSPNSSTNAPRKANATIGRRMRTYLLTGIAVAAPIAITISLLWFLTSWLDRRLSSLIPEAYNPNTYLPFSVPGLSILIGIALLMALGALTANFLGRFMIESGERLIDRLPIVRSIYGTTKQVFETIAQSSTFFQDVVLAEFPQRGSWSIGFITGQANDRIKAETAPDTVAVFIPMAMNPTGGFLLFVPRANLIKLDISVEDAIKIVLSAGLASSDDSRNQNSADHGDDRPVRQ